jgi:hypothetical protein
MRSLPRTTTWVAAVDEPKRTVEFAVNPDPAIVTLVPPSTGPFSGDSFVTIGTRRYLKRSAADVTLVPPGVVTVMATLPAPAGLVATIVVEFTIDMTDACFVPKYTVAGATKFVPVVVTLVTRQR